MSFGHFSESIMEALMSANERRPRVNSGFVEGGFMIAVEAPGVTKDTLRLTIQGDSLIFTGKPKSTSISQENAYSYEISGTEFTREFSFRAYNRSVARNKRLDLSGKIKVSFDSGIVFLTVPYMEEKPADVEVTE